MSDLFLNLKLDLRLERNSQKNREKLNLSLFAMWNLKFQGKRAKKRSINGSTRHKKEK